MSLIRGKYAPKKLKFDCKCKYCNVNFKAADVKCYTCTECKQPRECACGCGKIIKTPGRRFGMGCSTRGKTYKEIYGTSTPACGFKRGKDNPMANENSLNKVLSNINRGIKYKDIWFRSSYEVEIYKLICTHTVLREPTLKILDALYKPDFIVNNNIIEVSGIASATSKGRDRNIKKIYAYLEYTDFNVIFIVNKKFLPHYKHIINNKFKLMEYESTIHNEERIL
jgi:hypothetical protein